MIENPLICLIMDGVGESPVWEGNAFKQANTPNIDKLRELSQEGKVLYTQLKAHGKAVGLPSDADMGNSEVGHNAIGAGRVFDQGAKRVDQALESGAMFTGSCWQRAMQAAKTGSTLHFLGLLSDGNVHSHEKHLYKMMRQAVEDGTLKIRVHVLFDGRDVRSRSAEMYWERLHVVIDELRALGCDVAVASGGGRMSITMDRYQADWSMVERGWYTHVLGQAPHQFSSAADVIDGLRAEMDPQDSDQNIPAFVMVQPDGSAIGPVLDGDAVILFNFRGDRAIEICQAFEEVEFSHFDRIKHPKVFFAGMMEYDGDLHTPMNYLVEPPQIDNTLGEYLVQKGVPQFACSETQKFGHVTYFWNGNRSGYFSKDLETYVEVPSDNVQFDSRPKMKAQEIVDQLIFAVENNRYGFLRINLANGDMVGHTGHFEAAVAAMEEVDRQVGRVVELCEQKNLTLLLTADHGNLEEMLDNPKEKDPLKSRPKTSHTLNPVPMFIYNPQWLKKDCPWQIDASIETPGLANLANTFLLLLGMEARRDYEPGVVRKRIL